MAVKRGSGKKQSKASQPKPARRPNARTRAAMDEARAIIAAASLPDDPDLANAVFGVAEADPEIDEQVDEGASVQAWIPNARTRAAIMEARAVTLYKSARRHRRDAGA